MAIFLGTLIIVGLSCLLMSLGLLLSGRPLSGGCGRAPGTPRCDGCVARKCAAGHETEGDSGC